MSTGQCADHGSLADELRRHAQDALDLVEPFLDRVRERPADPEPEPASCAVCPVCALITVLRGGRSELAVRLAEQLTGLLTTLRTALAEGVGAPPVTTPVSVWPPHPVRTTPRVQRITVRNDEVRTRPTARSSGPC